jgi:predicted ATPase
MTCMIGARGTCKSTLVESIRFAFGADPERVAELVASDRMITKTLGAGSVTCLLEVVEDGIRDTIAEDLLHEVEIYSQG